MDAIARLGTLLGLSFISGVNLYATVAVVGLSIKYGLVHGLPPELGVLANNAVLTIAIVLYCVEFLVDKVPGLDTLWDSLHTIIRPIGGAFLALMQVGHASPVVQVITFLLGAALASAAHFSKAGTRLVVNASPEPFSNMVLSTTEDIAVFGLAYLSIKQPVLAFFVIIALLALTVAVAPTLLRAIRMLVSALWHKLKNLFRGGAAWQEASSAPSMREDALLDDLLHKDETILWRARGYSGKIPGVPRFTHILLAASERSIFCLYRRRFKLRSQNIHRSDVDTIRFYPGRLFVKGVIRARGTAWSVLFFPSTADTVPQDLGAPKEPVQVD